MGGGGEGGTADTRETLERVHFHITKDIILLQALALFSSLPGIKIIFNLLGIYRIYVIYSVGVTVCISNIF